MSRRSICIHPLKILFVLAPSLYAGPYNGFLYAQATHFAPAPEEAQPQSSTSTVPTPSIPPQAPLQPAVPIQPPPPPPVTSLPGIADSTPTVRSAPVKLPEISISGVVLTPTAYRGRGRINQPGLGLDINAAYYIGRLYGKNDLPFSLRRTNYIDRVGVWFLTADGKMQIQSEGDFRPAMAVGAQGIFTFRDAPQSATTFQVKVSDKTQRSLSDAYVVASKNLRGARVSVGFMQGNTSDQIPLLTEFLSPQAMQFAENIGPGQPVRVPTSKSLLFGSLLYMAKPKYPLGIEFMKPQGAPRNPILINFKLGYFLHLNFDVAYLRFDGGWDLLGNFQVRWTYFPR